jgi:ferredoxin
MTTITVLTERCISSGNCMDVAPDVFDMDEDGLTSARLDEVHDTQHAQAERAAVQCPVQAILLSG